MGFLTVFLYALHVIACIVLIVVVLLHESKGDSLSSVFGGGGADSAFGVQFGKKINRFTVGAAVVFMAMSVLLGILSNQVSTIAEIGGNKPSVQEKADESGSDEQPAETPAGTGE